MLEGGGEEEGPVVHTCAVVAREEATKKKEEREREKECKIVWWWRKRGLRIERGKARGGERKGRREERWGERESRRGNKRQVRDGATGEPLVGAKSPLDGPPSVPTESHGAETRPGPYYYVSRPPPPSFISLLLFLKQCWEVLHVKKIWRFSGGELGRTRTRLHRVGLFCRGG